MGKRFLLVQSDPDAAKRLFAYLKKRGDQVWWISSVTQAVESIKRYKPDLIFLDLHLPGNDWLEALSLIQKNQPESRLIITNKHPDFHRELIARERGVRSFLRQPFSDKWIERAIRNSDTSIPQQLVRADGMPRVRISMRVKITLPYALLAMLFALGASYLVSRYVLESMRDRFVVQLIDTGKLASDWMVHEEDRLLETLRLLANTEGVVDALKSRDTDQLRLITLPVAMNYREEAIELLGIDGTSILSLHNRPGTDFKTYDATQGDLTLSRFGFVQNVLMGKVDDRGDKFAGLARTPGGDYLYLVGPVRDVEGNLAGVIAIGKSLTQITRQIRQDTLAHVSIYAVDGSLLSSTLFHADTSQAIPMNSILEILGSQDNQSLIRDYIVGSESYSEIMGPWEARGGQDLGIVGTALAQNFITRPSLVTRFQVIAVVIVAVVGVIILGLFLAHQITSPLSSIVKAAIEIAKGNLEVKVPSVGNDEVTVLAHAFNYMVSGLQEGFIYRDILGRTVSPEVREAMRQSFASGDLRLEGQSVVATVVMSDIRGFTALAEKENPTTILKWLNEYFGVMTPVITANGGVVDKFEGDAMLAFFGILPRPLTAEESAYQACRSALRLVEAIHGLNIIRASRGEPALNTGIGVNTGTLIAGGLGASDRLNYTVIGDVVNTTQRIESVTKSFVQGGIAISESTLTALKDHRGEFRFEPLGEHALEGKSELIWLYRLHGEREDEVGFGGWRGRIDDMPIGVYEDQNLVEE